MAAVEVAGAAVPRPEIAETAASTKVKLVAAQTAAAAGPLARLVTVERPGRLLPMGKLQLLGLAGAAPVVALRGLAGTAVLGFSGLGIDPWLTRLARQAAGTPW